MADTMTQNQATQTQGQQAQAPVIEQGKKKSRLESYAQAYLLSEVKVQKLLDHAKEQENALKSCNDPRAARKLTGEIVTTYTDAAKATKAAGRNLEAYLREEKSEERRKARVEAWEKLVAAVKNAIDKGFEAIFPKIPKDLQQKSSVYVSELKGLVDGLAEEVASLKEKISDLEAGKGVGKTISANTGKTNEEHKALAANPDSPDANKGQQESGKGIKQPYEHTIPEPPAQGIGQAVKRAAKDLGQAAKENGVDVGEDGRKAQQAVMDGADRLDASIDAAKSAPSAEVARAWTDVIKAAHTLTEAVGNYGKHVLVKAAEKGDKVRNVIGEKVRSMFKANKQAMDRSVPRVEAERIQAQASEQSKQIAALQAQMAELLTQNRIQAAQLQPAGPEKAAMVQGMLEDGISPDRLKGMSVPVESLRQFTGRAHKAGDGLALVDEKGKLVVLDKVSAEKLEHIRNRDEISISRKDLQSEFAFRNRTIEQALGQGKSRG